MIRILASVKILTDTVKNNDGCINGITNNSQHAGNKSITYRCSGNCIESKYNQHIMNQCKYRTACKADILKSEPDIQKHQNRSNNDGNDGISSHLIADSC